MGAPDHANAAAPTRAAGSLPHPARTFAIDAVIACIVAVNGAFIASLLLPMAELWWLDLGVYAIWPASSPYIGTYWLTAWLLGALVPGLTTAWLLTRVSDRRWFRALAACFGVACLALLALILWYWPTNAQLPPPPGAAQELTNPSEKVPFPLLHIVGLAAGVAVAAIVVKRKAQPIRRTRRARLGLVGVAAGFALVLGVPTFVETWAEYQPQDLPEFTIELAAAYPYSVEHDPGNMPAVVVDANGDIGDIVDKDGQRFNVHHTDAVSFRSESVRRVRWYDAGDRGAYISLRVDRDVAARLRKRSLARMSMHDALFVNGRLVSVPLYQTVITDRLWLHDPNRAEQRRLYEMLTRSR